jgi:hypothetical protein
MTSINIQIINVRQQKIWIIKLYMVMNPPLCLSKIIKLKIYTI